MKMAIATATIATTEIIISVLMFIKKCIREIDPGPASIGMANESRRYHF
jgi:hypothetical protein